METKSFITKNAAETQALGVNLGRLLQAPALITLEGDLGCGKTTFSQGLAKGLGVSSAYYVTSPTFAIVNEYPAKTGMFYHIDFYRLSTSADLEDLGFDDIIASNGFMAIEWASKFPSVFENMDRLEINIEHVTENSRKITLICYGQAYQNLLGCYASNLMPSGT